MHKSVMTRISSLILMSSLVMLAAPFANLNIFSNVMAQEYDKYEIVLIVNTQLTIRSMNVEQAH